MKKLFFVLLMVIVPLQLFAYTNVVEAPTDFTSLFAYFLANYKAASAAGVNAIVAFGIMIFVALFKAFAGTKTWFDKWGIWKPLFPMILAGIAEVSLNWPTSVSVSSIFALFIAGGAGTGALSVFFHHIIDNIINKK